jgi:hypothetical protein
MASIEKRVRNGRKTWRAHYRTSAGDQRSKSFARKVDAERYLAGVENSKVVGSYVDPLLARVTVARGPSGGSRDRHTSSRPPSRVTRGSCARTSIQSGTG